MSEGKRFVIISTRDVERNNVIRTTIYYGDKRVCLDDFDDINGIEYVYRNLAHVLNEAFETQLHLELAAAQARIVELEKENLNLETAIKIQANAVKTMQSCEAKIAEIKLREANRLKAECDPANINSEKEMNAILTEEITRLEAQNKAMRDAFVEAEFISSEIQELSMSNYNHDEVAALNSGSVELYLFLNEKLKSLGILAIGKETK